MLFLFNNLLFSQSIKLLNFQKLFFINLLRMEDNYFDKNPQKTTFFYVAIFFMVALSFLGIGVDLTEYSQKTDINIPSLVLLFDFRSRYYRTFINCGDLFL